MIVKQYDSIDVITSVLLGYQYVTFKKTFYRIKFSEFFA